MKNHEDNRKMKILKQSSGEKELFFFNINQPKY
jgi:hypothetical protein